MTMLYLERELRKTGDPEDERLANNIAGSLRWRRRDIHLPPNTEALLKDPDFMINALKTDTLDGYLNEPHTSKLLTKTWDNTWLLWGLELGIEFSVPPCPINTEEIKRLEEDGYMAIYVPEELSKAEGKDVLRKLFKFKTFNGFGYHTTPDDKQVLYNSIENQLEQSGWLSVEKNAFLSRQGIYVVREADKLKYLKDSLKSKDRTGQTIDTYIIASEFSDLFFRKPFDSGSTDTIVLFESTYKNQPLFVSRGYDKSIYFSDNLYCVRGARSAQQLQPQKSQKTSV